jgi:hypothetical protein
VKVFRGDKERTVALKRRKEEVEEDSLHLFAV